ncbi:DUF4412 domain-containing protein [Desulforhabdus amnigena]|nr:DUF4412 domain-containing protein [Desulforhabdus amnigena]NLJ29005.1 DUF4412 domain-containing protein [Deltaproteobacteria bacterium]
MMRFMVAVAFCIVLISAPALAAEFSADMVFQPKGEAPMTAKVYVKGNKMRQEAMEEGEKQIVIVRPDKKVSWMIDPEEKKYIEMPYEDEENLFEEWSLEKQEKAKFLKEENAAGVPCKKYEIDEEGEKTSIWISTKHSFPVKVEDSETIVEYKNIRDGSLEDSLFELPEGYEKISVPTMDEDKEVSQ